MKVDLVETLAKIGYMMVTVGHECAELRVLGGP
jgi:hypothetical protein